MLDNDVSKKDALNYSWNYFQLHATQRMSLFNYFVVFASLLTTGLVSTFLEKYKCNYIGIALSLLLIILAFIFWKLDQRVKYLIRHSEELLKKIEKSFDETTEQPYFNLFITEVTKTEQLKNSNKLHRISTYHFSYSNCLNLVFLFFGAFGCIGLVLSLVKTLNPATCPFLSKM